MTPTPQIPLSEILQTKSSTTDFAVSPEPSSFTLPPSDAQQLIERIAHTPWREKPIINIY
jgi:hypothetical protein